MRIDAHHHLWTLARGDYGWLTPALAPIYRDFSLADLQPHLAAAGIEGTILVQAAPTEAETRFMLDIADGAEVVRGVVGWTDFDADDATARIEAMAASPLLVSLRPMVQDIPDDDWLLRPSLAPLLAAMAGHDLVFDALVFPRHLPRLLRVVDRHPELQFVLDHCAKPQIASGDIAAWRDDIALLAKRANIVCKLSGLATEAAKNWHIAALRPRVRKMVRHGGEVAGRSVAGREGRDLRRYCRARLSVEARAADNLTRWLVMPGLVPGIHVFLAWCVKDVDGRAFAAPKGLRPRRRDKPGHDEVERSGFVARATCPRRSSGR
jgi:L-fucono-1,5-lactonase